MTTELVRYDAMRRAIADAFEIDEVKEIRDKALALEIYYRQAKNYQDERRVIDIRIRAERKAGELDRERLKQQGARGNASNQHQVASPPSRPPKTLKELGVSWNQTSRWRKLADVPEDQFEILLSGPGKPTTNGIIAAAHKKKVTAVDHGALWLWGRLRDFERDGLLDRDPNEVCETMLDHMKQDMRELAPRVAAWLDGVKI